MPVTMVGAVAIPARRSATASVAGFPVPAASSGSSIRAAIAAVQPRKRWRGWPMRPQQAVEQSRRAGARRLEGQHAAPGGADALGVGVGEGDHFQRAEDRAGAEECEQQGREAGEAQRGAGRGTVRGAGGDRGFGAALGREEQHPGQQQCRAHRRTRLREEGGAQQRGEHRSEHETQLVRGLFEGVGGVPGGRIVAEQVRPARAGHPAGVRGGRGGGVRGEERPVGCVVVDTEQE